MGVLKGTNCHFPYGIFGFRPYGNAPFGSPTFPGALRRETEAMYQYYTQQQFRLGGLGEGGAVSNGEGGLLSCLFLKTKSKIKKGQESQIFVKKGLLIVER